MMKLYATIESERATKSQGGKQLTIEVRNEATEVIFAMKVLEESMHLWIDKNYFVSSYKESGQAFSLSAIKSKYPSEPCADCKKSGSVCDAHVPQKGKRQKGDCGCKQVGDRYIPCFKHA